MLVRIYVPSVISESNMYCLSTSILFLWRSENGGAAPNFMVDKYIFPYLTCLHQSADSWATLW